MTGAVRAPRYTECMLRVVWAAFVSACWAGKPVPPPISNAAPAPTSITSHRNVERWAGTGRQFDNGMSWDMVLTLRPGAEIGEDLGTISYPSLGCSGRVIREPDEGDSWIGREKITDDPDHRCVDGGAMLIPRGRGATFEWRWRHPTGEDGAEAMLSRQSSR